MRNYEVKLSRPVTQKLTTTVSVTAETEEAAIIRAIEHASTHFEDWASAFGDPATHGEITVEVVEPIVDLDEPVS